MKPLHHPTVEAITVEGILYALSDPVRFLIFSEVANSQHPKTCSGCLQLEGLTLPKSTLSQHFRILREAGLIRSERKGVEMHNTARCEELKPRFGEVISAIMAAYHEEFQSRRGGAG